MYTKVGKITPEQSAALFKLLDSYDPQPGPQGYNTVSSPELAKECEAVLDGVLPPWSNAFFLLIWPGGEVEPHEDWLAVKFGQRFQIVVMSNEACMFKHDGEVQTLDQDGIYTMDCTKTHGSRNDGKELRALLVVDVGEAR